MTSLERQTQLSIRIPEEWLKRIDAIGGKLIPGTEQTRANTLRAIMADGIAVLETRLGISLPATHSRVKKETY